MTHEFTLLQKINEFTTLYELKRNGREYNVQISTNDYNILFIKIIDCNNENTYNYIIIPFNLDKNSEIVDNLRRIHPYTPLLFMSDLILCNAMIFCNEVI